MTPPASASALGPAAIWVVMWLGWAPAFFGRAARPNQIAGCHTSGRSQSFAATRRVR